MCAPTRTLATVATIGAIALPIGAGTAVAAPIVVVGGGPALIAGEPKDQPPFTTQAAADPGLSMALHQAATGTIGPQAARRGRRPAAEPTAVERPASFSGTEASVGAGFAGAAICLIVTAALLARRRSAVP